MLQAPEILLGQWYDGKADLWSVGTILFQCLNGTAPFLVWNVDGSRVKYKLCTRRVTDMFRFLGNQPSCSEKEV